MKTRKKLLPILLALGIMLQSVPTVWAEDIVQQPDSATEYIYSESTDETTQQTDENGDSGDSNNANADTAQEDDTASDNGDADTEQEGDTAPDNGDTDTVQEGNTTPDNGDADTAQQVLLTESLWTNYARRSVINANVVIDHSEGKPSELAADASCTFLVREALSDVLEENGMLNEAGEYEGIIAYSTDNDSFNLIGWKTVC